MSYKNIKKKSYYEGGVSSCYFWDKDDGNFATAWLVRKSNGPIIIIMLKRCGVD